MNVFSKVWRSIRQLWEFLLPEAFSYLGYELHLGRNPVFLSQAVEQHGRLLLRRVKDRRTLFVLGLFFLVFADLRWGLFSAAVSLVGAPLLRALLERFFQVLLPVMGFLIPLAILAINSLRDALGPTLSSLAISKIRVPHVLAFGLVLVVVMGIVLASGAAFRPSSNGAVAVSAIDRVGAWCIIAFAVYLVFVFVWLKDMCTLFYSRGHFRFCSALVVKAHERSRKWEQMQHDLSRILNSTCAELGISTAGWTGQSIVLATKSGLLKDMNLYRFRRIVKRLTLNQRETLIVVASPGYSVHAGDPLIRVKANGIISPSIAKELQTCFRIVRRSRFFDSLSRGELFDLVKEGALRHAGDQRMFEQWLGLFGCLGKNEETEQLDWFAQRSLSLLVKGIAERGCEDAQATLAQWLYSRASSSLGQGYNAAYNYLEPLRRLFQCSIKVGAQRGIDRPVYYLLKLGMYLTEDICEKAEKEKLYDDRFTLLEEIVQTLAGMITDALEVERLETAKYLWGELCKLVERDTIPKLYSCAYTEDVERTSQEAIDRLQARLDAACYFISAWGIERYLAGRISSTLARQVLKHFGGRLASPGRMLAALERIAKHELWVGAESFRPQPELLSPLGETFWEDKYSPFLRVYIIVSLMCRWEATAWPQRASRTICNLWSMIRRLCEEIKAYVVQYKELIPQVSEEHLDSFLELHQRLVALTEQAKKEQIATSNLVPATVARFANRCVENFQALSVVLNVFLKQSPNSIERSHANPPARVLSVQGLKEPFTKEKEPLVIAPGDPWAKWNDALCMWVMKQHSPEPGSDLEEAGAQMAASQCPPETLLVSPGMRQYFTQLAQFRRPTPNERKDWGDCPILMGFWKGLPVVGTALIPNGEVWLVNLSSACKLTEFLEAKPIVEPVEGHPLEVEIRFPQRLQLRILRPEGLRYVSV